MVIKHHFSQTQDRTLSRPIQNVNFCFLEGDLLVCFGFLFSCRIQVLFGLRSQMARHFPSGCFGGQQNSWFNLSQQVFQVLKEQNSSRPLHFQNHISFLAWCSFSWLLRIFWDLFHTAGRSYWRCDSGLDFFTFTIKQQTPTLKHSILWLNKINLSII